MLTNLKEKVFGPTDYDAPSYYDQISTFIWGEEEQQPFDVKGKTVYIDNLVLKMSIEDLKDYYYRNPGSTFTGAAVDYAYYNNSLAKFKFLLEEVKIPYHVDSLLNCAIEDGKTEFVHYLVINLGAQYSLYAKQQAEIKAIKFLKETQNKNRYDLSQEWLNYEKFSNIVIFLEKFGGQENKHNLAIEYAH